LCPSRAGPPPAKREDTTGAQVCYERVRFGLYKILFYFEAHVHESILFDCSLPTHIAHTITQCGRTTIARYTTHDAPPTPLLYAIHHAVLIVAISCKGQGTVRRMGEASNKLISILCTYLYLYRSAGWGGRAISLYLYYVHIYIYICGPPAVRSRPRCGGPPSARGSSRAAWSCRPSSPPPPASPRVGSPLPARGPARGWPPPESGGREAPGGALQHQVWASTGWGGLQRAKVGKQRVGTLHTKGVGLRKVSERQSADTTSDHRSFTLKQVFCQRSP